MLKRLQRTLYFLRIRSFDISTPEGRSDERHRRALLTTITSLFAKFVSVATGLITIPLTYNYLGPERYGMWVTMSSVVIMLQFADLGLGSGVLSLVANAFGRDDQKLIREVISSAIVALVGIAIFILVGLLISYSLVPWAGVFNLTSENAREVAAPTFAALIVCFAFALPFSVVQRVQLGLQSGFMAGAWQCVGSILGLIGVLTAVHLNANLPVLVIMLVGGPIISSVLNSFFFFFFLKRNISPTFSTISRRTMAQVMGKGSLFFVLQVVTAIGFASDNIVIAQVMNATAVAEYSLPQRLFGMVSVLINMALMPLWPAYGEAISRGDHSWARRTFIKSLILAILLSSVVSTVLVLSGNWLLQKWVGEGVVASLLLLCGLGVWQIVQTGGGAVSMYLFGASALKFQVATSVVSAIVAIVAKIYLVGEIGVSGVAWAKTFSYVFCVAIPTFIFLRNKFGEN